jgi:hypothetical protein
MTVGLWVDANVQLFILGAEHLVRQYKIRCVPPGRGSENEGRHGMYGGELSQNAQRDLRVVWPPVSLIAQPDLDILPPFGLEVGVLKQLRLVIPMDRLEPNFDEGHTV